MTILAHMFMIVIICLVHEEEDAIIFVDICEINHYNNEYVCVYMLIYLDV